MSEPVHFNGFTGIKLNVSTDLLTQILLFYPKRMELHIRQKSIFVFDTRLAVFYATLHNATSNCVDFVV